MTPADKLYEWLEKEKVNVMRSIFHGFGPQEVLFEDKTNRGEDRRLDEEWAIYPSDLPLKYANPACILVDIQIDTCGNISYAVFPDFMMALKEGKYDASLDWELLRDMVKRVLGG